MDTTMSEVVQFIQENDVSSFVLRLRYFRQPEEHRHHADELERASNRASTSTRRRCAAFSM